MKFGVATFFTGQGIGPAALAQVLEERGFDSLFVTEHTHIPASRRTPYPAGGELPERYYRLFDPFLARRDRLRRHRGRQNQQRQPGSDRLGTLSVARQVGDRSK
jgi:hypothetical protein